MIVYFICLFIVCMLAYIGDRCRAEKCYRGEVNIKKVPPNIFVVMIFLLFCFLYAFRWRVGTDFTGYYLGYMSYGQANIIELVGKRDWGFSVISCLAYKVFNGNFQLYNMVLGTITYFPVLYIYRKYSEDLFLTLFLYMTTLTCFWPYNGVRQSLAGSICFGAFSFLCNRKYIQYIACVIIASIFHATALVMLPLMLFLIMKPWSKKVIFLIGALIISVLFLGNIWTVIIEFLSFMGQDKMVSDYGNALIVTNGINGLRIVVAIIPVILAYLMHRNGLDFNNRQIQILENMIVLGAIFMFAASRLTILARFSSYFSFAVPLLFPRFKKIFTRESSKVFIVIVMICYIAYMAMLLPMESNLVPYKFCF